MIERVKDELLQGYPESTPVVIIYKASWPEQQVIKGTLKNIVQLVQENSIRKTALIYIGEALRASEDCLGKESRLYHKDFRHGYRR
jgi:precorrin-4/cobalt-precorrin-4 C11-methyltransferase